MADKKLTDVTTTASSTSADYVILIQSNAVKKVALSNLSAGVSETRVNELIDAKLPPSAEGVQY